MSRRLAHLVIPKNIRRRLGELLWFGQRLKLGATSASRPTDTDFNAQVTRLKEAGCDLVCMGTIVKDTVIILQTAHKSREV